MTKTGILFLGMGLAMAACVDAPDDAALGGDQQALADLDTAPTGHGGGVFEHFQQPGPDGNAKHGGGGNNGISYHGGPVMTAPVNVYLIYYGAWSNLPTDQSLIQSFVANLGGSPYYRINTTYTDGAGVPISGAVNYAGSTIDNYSEGFGVTNLSTTNITNIVSRAVDNGSFGVGPDANAVYFVLTTSDLTQTKSSGSAFCTSFCGWHNVYNHGGANLKYSFVGDPRRCPSSCEAQATGPNGTQSADGMVSIIAHELEEANTDPELTAWFDRRGAENADKCAWMFGTQSTAANGATYNLTLGGNKYLVQQNWVNAAGGYCATSYP